MANNIGFQSLLSQNYCGTEGDEYCGHDDLDQTAKSTVRVSGHTGYCDIKVPAWDTVGCEEDNIVRVYAKGECTCLDGKYWFAKNDTTVTKPSEGSADWEGGFDKCELLRPLNAQKLCEVINTFPVSSNKIGG